MITTQSRSLPVARKGHVVQILLDFSWFAQCSQEEAEAIGAGVASCETLIEVSILARIDVPRLLKGAVLDGGWMSRALIVIGLVLVAVGLLWPFIGRLGLGRLPGDISIQRPNFAFYFPIMTSLIISIVVSVVLWLVNR